MLDVIWPNSAPLSVFVLIISALLLVLSASSVTVGLLLSVSQFSLFFEPFTHNRYHFKH